MSRLPAAAAVVAVLALAPHAGGAQSFVIHSDLRIGSYAVKKDGSLGGAIRAFGRPRLRGGGEICTAGWSRYGLTIGFYNFAGHDSCDPRYGRFSKAVVYGSQWRTSKGLRVGLPTRAIHTLYPGARLRKGLRGYWPTGWWLVTRRSPFGGRDLYPGLLAQAAGGMVVSLQVRFPAGGD